MVQEREAEGQVYVQVQVHQVFRCRCRCRCRFRCRGAVVQRYYSGSEVQRCKRWTRGGAEVYRFRGAAEVQQRCIFAFLKTENSRSRR